MSHFLRIYALVLMLAILAGCALPQGGTKPGPAKPQPAPSKSATVAIVVPRTEAAKVVRALIDGARLGASKQTGANPAKLRIIYTDGNWLNQIAQLPDNSVVGGLLSDAAYNQMKGAGLLEKKVVFAFRSKLPAGDEGTRAWRFFHSLEDQVKASTAFCVDALGVQSAAAFGPSDPFSNAYIGLLEKELAGRGVALQRISAGGDASQWGAILQPVVNPQTNETTGVKIPQTPFKAVFLTDTWRRLPAVTAAFASNGEERLYMIGTAIWDDTNVRGSQDAAKYALVAWPSAFLRNTAPASLANTNFGNFWGALGYDFVRFASRLNIKGRPDSAAVTAAARSTSSMSFAMAPISYNAQGKASQKLYMVQAGTGSTVLADSASMMEAKNAAVQRVEMRGVAPETTPDGQPVQPGQDAPLAEAPEGSVPPVSVSVPVQPKAAAPRTAPAAQPANAPIMRTTPNSSYKLSLPGAR